MHISRPTSPRSTIFPKMAWLFTDNREKESVDSHYQARPGIKQKHLDSPDSGIKINVGKLFYLMNHVQIFWPHCPIDNREKYKNNLLNVFNYIFLN